MKAIDKDKLIGILSQTDTKTLFEDDILKILKEHGDDWFIVDGMWTLTKKAE